LRLERTKRVKYNKSTVKVFDLLAMLQIQKEHGYAMSKVNGHSFRFSDTLDSSTIAKLPKSTRKRIDRMYRKALETSKEDGEDESIYKMGSGRDHLICYVDADTGEKFTHAAMEKMRKEAFLEEKSKM
jgi:hypothetical protein